MKKENDWLVANLANPEFSVSDLKSIGDLSLENTQFLTREEYKAKPKVQEMFTGEDGKFNETAFNQSYNNLVGKWNDFIDDSITDTFEHSMWDIDIAKNPKKSKIKDPHFEYVEIPNPDRVSIGITGMNIFGDREFSASELAQKEKVVDSKTGKELNYSPNDKNLFENPIEYFKSIFDDPLVLATWDLEGDHKDPITGSIVHHDKGEKKLNKNGTYYYETLGDRSLRGKEVLSALDMITVDGTKINKYDFLDSDGLEKDTSGVIAKNLLAVAPMAFLNPTGAAIYSGLFVTKELMKTLPMLYGWMTAISNDNIVEPKNIRYLEGLGKKLSSGTTEHSKEKMFTLENFGNLISDVALQWGQQRFVAESITKLRGLGDPVEKAGQKALNKYISESSKKIQQMYAGGLTPAQVAKYTGMKDFSQEGLEKLITSGEWLKTPLGVACREEFIPLAIKVAEKNAELGQKLGLAYMCLVSNTDVYSSALEHGATKQEAAALSIATTALMFGVDDVLGLGEIFYDDAKVENIQKRYLLKKILKEKAGEAVDEMKRADADDVIRMVMKSEAKEAETNKLLNWMKKGVEKIKDGVIQYENDLKNHALGFTGKAIGEGLEEVIEELVTDVSKSAYELAHKFGLTSQESIGAWDQALERYTMSFIGGSLGGGLFYGVDAIKKPKSVNEDKAQRTLEYFVANHQTDEIIKLLDQLHKDGKLGSTTLSVDLTEDTDENGKRTYLSASDKHMSQNDFIYNAIKSNILSLDATLNEYGLNLSEDELFDQMVQKEIRFMELKDYLQDTSYLTGYQQLFRQLTHNIFELINKKEIAAKTIDGVYKEGLTEENFVKDSYKRTTAEQARYDANMKAYDEKIKELFAERDAFKSGQYSPHYVSMTLWAADTGLSAPFLTMNLNQYARKITGKSFDFLTDTEKVKIKEMWENYKTNGKFEKDVQTSYNKFYELSRELDPTIQELAEGDLKAWDIALKQLEKYSMELQLLNYDSRIQDTTNPSNIDYNETEDAYNHRYTKYDNETDEQFGERVTLRKAQIDKYNQDHAINYLENLIANNPFIDNVTRRKIIAQLGIRKKDIIINEANNLFDSAKKASELEENTGKIDLDFYQKASNIIKELNPDLSNKDEILLKLKDTLKVVKENKIRLASGHIINTNLLKVVKEWMENQGLDTSIVSRDNVMEFFDLAYDEFNEATENKYVKNSKEAISEFLKFLETLETEKYLDKIFGYSIDNDRKGIIELNLEDWRNRNLQLERLEELDNIKDEDLTPELEQERNELRDIWESTEDYYYENDDATISKLIEDGLEEEEAETEKTFEKIINSIISDPWYKSLSQLDQKVNMDMNPSIKLIKSIAKQLGEGFNDIEQTLNTLYEYFLEGKSAEDFTLTTEQTEALTKAAQLLEYGKAVIMAASIKKRGTFKEPIGHNAIVNDFIQKYSEYKGQFNPMPIMSDEIANILINDINRYQSEINQWIARSNSNIANKNKKLINTGKALVAGKIKFWKMLNTSESMLITKGGVNLLEGIDLTSAKTEADLHNIQNKFYVNIQHALKTESFEDVFAFLPKILNINNAIRLQLTEINDKFDYDKMSDYYKFTYIMTCAAVDSTTVMRIIKLNISDEEKLAPLATQEEAFKMMIAATINPEFINNALHLLNNFSGKNLPVLTNSVIVIGVGGAGKTQAEAKQFAKYFENKVYLSGPTTKLSDQLKEVIPAGQTVEVEELLQSILGNSTYEQMKSDVKKTSDFDTFTKSDGLDEENTIILKDDITIGTNSAPIKGLIFDEATHLNNPFALVLGRWANKNNLVNLFMGDDVQNGANDFGYNINYEVLLGWRTPKLSISLRDANIQKIQNLQRLITPIQEALASNNEEYDIARKSLFNALLNLELHGYIGSNFKGDIITKTLSPELIKSIALEPSIAFVGTTDSEIYKQLIKSGINPQVLSPKEIQGREFGYVIVDRNDWEIPNNTIDDKHPNLGELIRFSKDLYTMISRSKEGTIIIDSTNSLNKFFKKSSILDENTGVVPKLNISEFKKLRERELELLDLVTDVKVDDSVSSSSPKKTNSESISGGHKLESFKDTFEENINEYTEPILTYGSISLLGINQVEEDGNIIWLNDGNNRDLGIVMDPDLKLITKKEKDEAVDKLFALKSLLLYNKNGYYEDPNVYRYLVGSNRLVSGLIPLETLKSGIEYYVEISDKTDNDHLIGDTMDSDKLDIENGKKFLVIAKWIAPDGRECTLTLGALGNPKTWKDNLDSIKNRLENKINDGEDVETNRAYLEKLPTMVDRYEATIKKLASEGNKLIKISKPDFSGFTNLIKTPDEKSIRLESVNDSRTPFFNLDQHGQYSNLYGIWSELKENPNDDTEEGIFKSIIGKSVIFASANKLLNPNDLIHLYLEQKRGRSNIPQVRMIVLDNKGVSYQSLYDEDFTELYNSNGKDSSYFPFELIPMGVRMYTSLWNTRANIKQFKLNLESWANNEHISMEEVENRAQLDSKFYREALSNKQTSDPSITYINEDEYHEWVRANKSKEDFDKVQSVWDFNFGLATSVRQFRLGYHPRTGAYVRKLTGITEENPFYTTNYNKSKTENKQTVESYDKVMGIYISPKFLNLWENSIDIIFKEVLDKVINPNEHPELKDKINKWINPHLPDKWFNKDVHIKDNKLRFGFDSEIIDLKLLNGDLFKAIPIVLTFIGKNISMYKHSREYVEKVLNTHKNDPTYTGKYNSEKSLLIRVNDSEEVVDWMSIIKAFEGNIQESVDDDEDNENTLPVGFIKSEYTETHSRSGELITIKENEDVRFENMMNLIFHGCIATRTLNDFDQFLLRASDAWFKHGFLVDPVYAKLSARSSATTPDPFTEVHSSMKFFGSDVKVGFPLIYIKLSEIENPIINEERKEEEKILEEKSKIDPIKKNMCDQALSKLGIELNPIDFEDKEELELAIIKATNTSIINLFNFSSQDTIQDNFNNCKIYQGCDDIGNLKIISISEIPGLKGNVISKITLDSGNIIVTLSDNKLFKLLKNDNTIEAISIVNALDSESDKSLKNILSEIKLKFDEVLSGKTLYSMPDENDWDYDEDDIVFLNESIPLKIDFNKLWNEHWNQFINIVGDDAIINDEATLQNIMYKANMLIKKINDDLFIGTLIDNKLTPETIELTINEQTCNIFKS